MRDCQQRGRGVSRRGGGRGGGGRGVSGGGRSNARGRGRGVKPPGVDRRYGGDISERGRSRVGKPRKNVQDTERELVMKESLVAKARPGDGDKMEKEDGLKCNNAGDVMSKKGKRVKSKPRSKSKLPAAELNIDGMSAAEDTGGAVKPNQVKRSEVAPQLIESMSSPKKSTSSYPRTSSSVVVPNLSKSTGLKVFSLTSRTAGYVFTPVDRAIIVKTIHGVVIINTLHKGDVLILGVESEDDDIKILEVFSEHHPAWSVSPVNTVAKDPFSYFAGWGLIPRVDKSGMFQLIVDLKTPGRRSRDAETSLRNQLLELIKDCSIARVVHGPGETILLVTHVLECVAYSDMIRKKFNMEKRHTWQPRPDGQVHPPPHGPGQDRYFWVKVKCPDLNNLTTAHKQYSVFHHLSSAGKVLQLEHQLFGVEDNYLVVYRDLGISKGPELGQQFCVLELLPDSLPDKYLPTYGVDAWGFYSVSGRFPENISDDARNKFAEEMKNVGAVGFRSGESDNSFSLHFVNSRCLELLRRSAQFAIFRLTILSDVVRKASLDLDLKRMVPSILKYKELKERVEIQPREEYGRNKLKCDEQKKVAPGNDFKNTKGSKASISSDQGSIEGIKNNNVEVRDEIKVCGEMSEMKSSDELLDIIKGEVKTGDVVELDEKLSQNVDEMQVLESDLLKICWTDGANLHSTLKSLALLLKSTAKVVDTSSTEVVFVVAKSKFEKELGKLSKRNPVVKNIEIQRSKFFKNKYGLVLEKMSTVVVTQLMEDFSKYDVEVEIRSEVFVLWFHSRIHFYRALTDPGLKGYDLVPSVQNFQFVEAASAEPIKPIVENLDSDQIHELTEREIFGFVWQKEEENKTRIRDDQVISRQLTNFIKNVSCSSLSVGDEGLIIRFSSQAEKEAALAQFCSSPVPDKDQLAALARKFTLLPFRGSFGLFSVKRVKPSHFSRIGDCKIRNCGIWFADKVSLFRALRDPMIKKTYSTLFIDCRNIFILSSKESVTKTSHKDSVKKTKPLVAMEDVSEASKLQTIQPVGVMTRSAMARVAACRVQVKESEIDAKSDHDELKSDNLAIPVSEEAPKTALEHAALSNGEMLLKALLPTDEFCHKMLVDKTVLGQGKFGYNLGKIPVKLGKKGSKVDNNDEEFFEKEFDNNHEESALIENQEEGKNMQDAANMLKKIKINRVEEFLKDKLGVDCRISKEGKEKLKAGGMVVEDGTVELNRVLKKVSKVDYDAESMDKNDVKKRDVVKVDYDAAESEDEKRQRLLRKEAEKRCFVKEALIFPSEMTHEIDIVKFGEKEIDCNNNGLEDKSATTKMCIGVEETESSELKSSFPSANLKLTQDILGLYTLIIPVTGELYTVTISNMKEDILWFEKPVSFSCLETMTGTIIEVKFREEASARTVLHGLENKYSGIVGDVGGMFKNIVKDDQTGLYTLCFNDIHRKRFKATMDKFSVYSQVPPVISRGGGSDQVLVGFQGREEAIEALRENIECEEFPGLHVAPVSRNK